MKSVLHTQYIRFKSALPEPVRDALSAINQRFFARRTIQSKCGPWFDVDWRKKFRTLTDEEWKRAYDVAWKHQPNDCVDDREMVMILNALGELGSVLEVGCGSGSVAVRLAQAGFAVTGLDVSREALQRAHTLARNAGASVAWKEGFAEKIPYPDKSFDYISCCHTLEHVRDLGAVVAEFKRVARKKIIVLTPKQKFRLYAENYHTQFFDRTEKLTDAFGLRHFECREIDCVECGREFQGRAFFYVGYLG